MDPHMEELFEKAPPFSESELTFHPDYERYSAIADALEDLLMECFGGEVLRLINEYTAAQFEVERFQCLHYFHQGYLAAKAEENPDLEPSFPLCYNVRRQPCVARLRATALPRYARLRH